MQFGLFFELSVPRPWGPSSERDVYRNSLAQAQLADELGFDQIWLVEHHFLEEYSHSSAPDLFMAAAAMLTKHVRLCHGIAVCVPQLTHPVRMAERVAVLDVLSGGRVEVGTGRSNTWTELGGFHVDPNDTKKTWDEFVRVLPKMWTQERFSWQGRCFSMPERMVLPKPLQKPHPPMWVAVTSPGTEVDAADRGLGSLGLSLAGLSEQEQKIVNYRKRIQLCEPVGEFVNEAVNTVNFLYCHEDPEHAGVTGRRLAHSFSLAAAQLLDIKESYPTPSYKSPGLLSAIRQDTDGSPRKGPEGLAYGTPDQIVAVLRRWEALGVDRVVFIVNALEAVPHQEVCDSLRLFAREVMPAFGVGAPAGDELVATVA